MGSTSTYFLTIWSSIGLMIKTPVKASLVVQWLRILLAMQEHQIQEDPTCHRATKPMPHNDQVHTLKLLKPTHPRACAPQQEKPQQ